MTMSYKRRRYLIKRAFQLKYMGAVLFFIFLTGIIFSAAIYVVVFPYLSEKLADVYPQGRLLTVLRQANLKVFISLLFLVPLAAWFSIILSHRIAGPWYRLEMILGEIAEGSPTSEIKLRKGDELQSLADGINRLTGRLKSITEEELGYLGSLDQNLKMLESELNKEEPDSIKVRLITSKLQGNASDLNSLIKKYNLSP